MNVENAGLRELTVQSTRTDGTGELIGLYYSGTPTSGPGLRVIRVQIGLSSGSGDIGKDAWGVHADTGCTGLSLDQVSVEADLRTPFNANLFGIALRGNAVIRDASVKVLNRSNRATGLWINPNTTGVTIDRATIRAVASGADMPDGVLGVDVTGAGTVTLRQCATDTGDLYSTGVRASSGADVRLESCTLACSLGAVSGFTGVKADYGALTMAHSRVTSPATAGVTAVAAVGSITRFRALYCELQGVRSTGGLPTNFVSYFRCVETDSSGAPVQEIHTSMTVVGAKGGAGR